MKQKAGIWFGEKTHYKDYVFDSKKEEAFFRGFIENSGYKFDVHKSFKLHPIIEMCNGVLKLRSSSYAPDFVLYDDKGNISHVIDVKNSFTSFAIDPAAALRFKLFALKYKIPVEVVVPRVKSFRVKIMGTTKKFEPIVKYDFNYNVNDLVGEAYGGNSTR
ncbi:hypothetical protein CBG04_09790 [Limosilactobacillus reuteri]|uniref:DUF1064 domain-containing protein n=1 Tax=Limosilactobacillus reuteri TaxID=1598 RepID=UPI000B992F38|nr:DUF1064 domain-containing protein [Limosilactobacillus reuteri]OYS80640.1 hypothetical protein CBG11_07400 [Limosilactobacillus reuteri]OYS81375.1 hypothetical protein CBG04_09790 [Limosilactobacillus reuteri]OYS83694.1 hypothetical protein CBG14_07140 [Limosilactobacillus reuteri]